jgi:probable HAF family extracellular repeat protein
VTQNPPGVQAIPLPTSDAFIGAHADSINNSGVVVGTCWTAASYDGEQTAYIYADGVSTDLNTLISASGWHLEFATSINDAGLITGFGTFNGRQTSFLLTPAQSRWGRIITVPELVAILIFGGVTVDGGGWVVLPGGPPIPVGPWGEESWNQLSSSKRDALLGMALDEVAKYFADSNVRTLVRNAILEGTRISVGQLSAAGGKQVEMAYRKSVSLQMSRGKTPHALRRFGLALS